MENFEEKILDEEPEVTIDPVHEHTQEEDAEETALPEPDFDLLCAALDGLLFSSIPETLW